MNCSHNQYKKKIWRVLQAIQLDAISNGFSCKALKSEADEIKKNYRWVWYGVDKRGMCRGRIFKKTNFPCRAPGFDNARLFKKIQQVPTCAGGFIRGKAGGKDATVADITFPGLRQQVLLVNIGGGKGSASRRGGVVSSVRGLGRIVQPPEKKTGVQIWSSTFWIEKTAGRVRNPE